MADPDAGGQPRRLAVIDLGSNSFRLVVFAAVPGRWWRRTDEIYEPVRIGAGMAASGRLGEAGMERAVHTIVTYAHYCRATGLVADQVSALATSAIREAANRDESLARAREAYLILNAGLPGSTPREVALIAQAARYHCEGSPGFDDLSALGRDGVGTDLD